VREHPYMASNHCTRTSQPSAICKLLPNSNGAVMLLFLKEMLKNTDKNINCSVCIFTSEIWILLRAHKAYRRGGKLPHGAYV